MTLSVVINFNSLDGVTPVDVNNFGRSGLGHFGSFEGANVAKQFNDVVLAHS